VPLFSSTVALFVGVSVETREDYESLFVQRCQCTALALDISSGGPHRRAKSAFTRVFDALWSAFTRVFDALRGAAQGDPPAPMPAARNEPGGIEAANSLK
jgi:hypothetical protein